MSDRQRAVVALVRNYRRVAEEMPSAGWLARRLGVSRQRARHHLETIRARGWLDKR